MDCCWCCWSALQFPWKGNASASFHNWFILSSIIHSAPHSGSSLFSLLFLHWLRLLAQWRNEEKRKSGIHQSNQLINSIENKSFFSFHWMELIDWGGLFLPFGLFGLVRFLCCGAVRQLPPLTHNKLTTPNQRKRRAESAAALHCSWIDGIGLSSLLLRSSGALRP